MAQIFVFLRLRGSVLYLCIYFSLSNRLTVKKSFDNTTYILYIIIVTARELMKKLETHGWVLVRINGSHHIYDKEGYRPVSVPFHGNKELGMLGKRILKQAGIKD